ncbi:MAG TPA: DJ-1 family glyoxalase III [Marinagarivorans sp.]
MTKVLVAIADGSEEMEATIIIDVLRRADIDVSVASVMPERKITASRGVQITADCHIEYCQNRPWDMVVLPGGMPGAEHLAASKALRDIIADQLASRRWLAAICAAPAVVLAAQGLIKNFSATCYPAFRALLEEHGVHAVEEPVAIYKELITSQGPGTAMAFALKLVELLKGEVQASAIAQAMCFQR